jgi:hypothetical protein
MTINEFFVAIAQLSGSLFIVTSTMAMALSLTMRSERSRIYSH